MWSRLTSAAVLQFVAQLFLGVGGAAVAGWPPVCLFRTVVSHTGRR